MEMIRIIIKNVGEQPYLSMMMNDLRTPQGIVGGYMQIVPVGDGMYLVCNEDGIMEGLPPNFRTDVQDIYGNVFFVRVDDVGEFKSVTQQDYDILIDYMVNRAEAVY